eukprot:g10234.t1
MKKAPAAFAAASKAVGQAATRKRPNRHHEKRWAAVVEPESAEDSPTDETAGDIKDRGKRQKVASAAEQNAAAGSLGAAKTSGSRKTKTPRRGRNGLPLRPLPEDDHQHQELKSDDEEHASDETRHRTVGTLLVFFPGPLGTPAYGTAVAADRNCVSFPLQTQSDAGFFFPLGGEGGFVGQPGPHSSSAAGGSGCGSASTQNYCYEYADCAYKVAQSLDTQLPPAEEDTAFRDPSDHGDWESVAGDVDDAEDLAFAIDPMQTWFLRRSEELDRAEFGKNGVVIHSTKGPPRSPIVSDRLALDLQQLWRSRHFLPQGGVLGFPSYSVLGSSPRYTNRDLFPLPADRADLPLSESALRNLFGNDRRVAIAVQKAGLGRREKTRKKVQPTIVPAALYYQQHLICSCDLDGKAREKLREAAALPGEQLPKHYRAGEAQRDVRLRCADAILLNKFPPCRNRARHRTDLPLWTSCASSTFSDAAAVACLTGMRLLFRSTDGPQIHPLNAERMPLDAIAKGGNRGKTSDTTLLQLDSLSREERATLESSHCKDFDALVNFNREVDRACGISSGRKGMGKQLGPAMKRQQEQLFCVTHWIDAVEPELLDRTERPHCDHGLSVRRGHALTSGVWGQTHLTPGYFWGRQQNACGVEGDRDQAARYKRADFAPKKHPPGIIASPSLSVGSRSGDSGLDAKETVDLELCGVLKLHVPPSADRVVRGGPDLMEDSSCSAPRPQRLVVDVRELAARGEDSVSFLKEHVESERVVALPLHVDVKQRCSAETAAEFFEAVSYLWRHPGWSAIGRYCEKGGLWELLERSGKTKVEVEEWMRVGAEKMCLAEQKEPRPIINESRDKLAEEIRKLRAARGEHAIDEKTATVLQGDEKQKPNEASGTGAAQQQAAAEAAEGSAKPAGSRHRKEEEGPGQIERAAREDVRRRLPRPLSCGEQFGLDSHVLAREGAGFGGPLAMDQYVDCLDLNLQEGDLRCLKNDLAADFELLFPASARCADGDALEGHANSWYCQNYLELFPVWDHVGCQEARHSAPAEVRFCLAGEGERPEGGTTTSHLCPLDRVLVTTAHACGATVKLRWYLTEEETAPLTPAEEVAKYREERLKLEELRAQIEKSQRQLEALSHLQVQQVDALAGVSNAVNGGDANMVEAVNGNVAFADVGGAGGDQQGAVDINEDGDEDDDEVEVDINGVDAADEDPAGDGGADGNEGVDFLAAGADGNGGALGDVEGADVDMAAPEVEADEVTAEEEGANEPPPDEEVEDSRSAQEAGEAQPASVAGGVAGRQAAASTSDDVEMAVAEIPAVTEGNRAAAEVNQALPEAGAGAANESNAPAEENENPADQIPVPYPPPPPQEADEEEESPLQQVAAPAGAEHAVNADASAAVNNIVANNDVILAGMQEIQRAVAALRAGMEQLLTTPREDHEFVLPLAPMLDDCRERGTEQSELSQHAAPEGYSLLPTMRHAQRAFRPRRAVALKKNFDIRSFVAQHKWRLEYVREKKELFAERFGGSASIGEAQVDRQIALKPGQVPGPDAVKLEESLRAEAAAAAASCSKDHYPASAAAGRATPATRRTYGRSKARHLGAAFHLEPPTFASRAELREWLLANAGIQYDCGASTTSSASDPSNTSAPNMEEDGGCCGTYCTFYNHYCRCCQRDCRCGKCYYWLGGCGVNEGGTVFIVFPILEAKNMQKSFLNY